MGRFLVTGCAGFIGARTTQQLLDGGHEVVGLDNLNEAYDRRLKDWRCAQLEGQSGLKLLKADITDREALAEVFLDGDFDGVINMAAYAGVHYSVENPWVYYETNVTGTLNLLEACREAALARLEELQIHAEIGGYVCGKNCMVQDGFSNMRMCSETSQ